MGMVSAVYNVRRTAFWYAETHICNWHRQSFPVAVSSHSGFIGRAFDCVKCILFYTKQNQNFIQGPVNKNVYYSNALLCKQNV